MPKICKGYTFLASMQIYQCYKRVIYYCKIHIDKKSRSKIHKIHGQHETHFYIWGLLTPKSWYIDVVSILFFNTQNFRIIDYLKLEEIHTSLFLTILSEYSLKINHMTKSIVQTLFELWQVWYRNHFHEEAVPVSNLLLSEEPFLSVPLELLLVQVHSISSCPIAVSPERGHQLLQYSFRKLYSAMRSPFSLLQDKQNK